MLLFCKLAVCRPWWLFLPSSTPTHRPLSEMKAGPLTVKTPEEPGAHSVLLGSHYISYIHLAAALNLFPAISGEETPGSRVSSQVPFWGRKASPLVACIETRRERREVYSYRAQSRRWMRRPSLYMGEITHGLFSLQAPEHVAFQAMGLKVGS